MAQHSEQPKRKQCVISVQMYIHYMYIHLYTNKYNNIKMYSNIYIQYITDDKLMASLDGLQHIVGKEGLGTIQYSNVLNKVV